MTRVKRVLVIEDDPAVARLLSGTLLEAGFDARLASTGQQGLQTAREFRPTLILLDLGLPDLPGITVLEKLREWYSAPVLILTANDSDEDKVAALDGGADDYVTKPFSLPELLARVRVALRHHEKVETGDQIEIGPYSIDLSTQTVRLDGEVVRLTATEYSILKVLVRSRGKVVTHRALLKEVWGPNSVEHLQYVRVYVGQLRKKLRSTAVSEELIQTELGVGYRLIFKYSTNEKT